MSIYFFLIQLQQKFKSFIATFRFVFKKILFYNCYKWSIYFLFLPNNWLLKNIIFIVCNLLNIHLIKLVFSFLLWSFYIITEFLYDKILKRWLLHIHNTNDFIHRNSIKRKFQIKTFDNWHIKLNYNKKHKLEYIKTQVTRLKKISNQIKRWKLFGS